MKKILRIQLLLLAFVCATTAYAQVVQTFGDKYYYDWFQKGANDEIIYEDDSHPAWITTVDSGEWGIDPNEPGAAVGPNGQFRFGSSNYNDGSANNGKVWGTVSSPDFEVDQSLTLELDFSESNHAGWKNIPQIIFDMTYKDVNGTVKTAQVKIELRLEDQAWTITPDWANQKVVATHTSGTSDYTFKVPFPDDYNSDGHVKMSLRASGGIEIGAGGAGNNIIDVYGDNLVLRDDVDNTERLKRNANQKMRKVTIVRSYDKGWYTLSLPFDLTMKQFQRRYMASFDKDLADTYTWEEETCAEIWHYDSFDERSEIMHFKKHDADDPNLVLEAGVPYLIYVPADISSTLYDFTEPVHELTDGEITENDKVMVFTNIVLKNPASSVSTVTKGNASFASFASNLGKTDIADVIEDNYVYYLHTDSEGENPQLYKPQSGSTIIKGFRSYFYSPIDSPSRSLFFNDDEVTAIDKVDVQSEQKMPVFNLQGLHMNNDLNGLPRGIYIMNGKKYVVK